MGRRRRRYTYVYTCTLSNSTRLSSNYVIGYFKEQRKTISLGLFGTYIMEEEEQMQNSSYSRYPSNA